MMGTFGNNLGGYLGGLQGLGGLQQLQQAANVDLSNILFTNTTSNCSIAVPAGTSTASITTKPFFKTFREELQYEVNQWLRG